ncbi:MAG: hypothetical protein ABR550_01710, partial [Wenzhouxiangellaceae bacterium]
VQVLWAFAVAQPLYSKISENLPFLLAHRLEAGEVIAYALALLVVVPAVLGILVWVGFRISPAIGWLLRSLVIIILAFLIFFPLLANVWGMHELISMALASALALALAFKYDSRFSRGLLDILT